MSCMTSLVGESPGGPNTSLNSLINSFILSLCGVSKVACLDDDMGYIENALALLISTFTELEITGDKR